MGLFSDLSLSFGTKNGSFSLVGGKPTVSLPGAEPQIPVTALPPPPPRPWYMRPLGVAAIAGGALLLIILLRR